VFSRTFRQNCKAHISLKADDDVNTLQIRSIGIYPSNVGYQLKLSRKQKRFGMKANKKLVQEEILKELGNMVLLKKTYVILLQQPSIP